MSLHKQKGFTIVELLIVIVVIGILAAITIVAYNGVQQRAKNNQIVSVVRSYVNAFRAYEIDKGRLPGSGATGYQVPCLGTGYTDQRCSNGGDRVESTVFNTSINEYLKTIPPMPTDEVRTNSGIAYWRGANYEWNSITVQDIRFIQLGTTNCPQIGGTVYKSKDTATGGVVCLVSLN